MSMPWLVGSDNPQQDAEIMRSFESTAAAVAQYYAALKATGLPDVLAQGMARDFSALLWKTAIESCYQKQGG